MTRALDELVWVGTPLSLEELVGVARRGVPARLDEAARARVTVARDAIARIVDAGDAGAPFYGINTGFGALAERRIGAEDILKLQQNLVRSHAAGVGPALGVPETRAMMLLRAQTLSLGHSGARPEVIELLLAMLERGVAPCIPSQGSVGASGDLAPLAHLALVLIGEGEALVEGQRLAGGEALRRVGLDAVVLQAKEGLALINGTQFMAAVGGLALADAARLATVADIAGAMSVEAQKGSKRPFDARIQALRPHPGQATVAANLRALLAESELMESHRFCGRVQDAYSFRCMPQVHGASRDALGFSRGVLERELNSVTDNPLVFPEGKGAADVVSGGNFHGQPLALGLDLAAMALAELASISERRVEQLVNPSLSSGLPAFLTPNSGLNSGLMIAQVTSAALVSENKVLCHPASVDSIPSSAGREDHVSMGSISARKLALVVANVRRCLAIEVLAAAVGLDLRRPLSPSRGVRAALAAVRGVVPPLGDDRPLHRDIETVAGLIESGALIEAVEAEVGALA